MNVKIETEKKVWIVPALDELAIEKTLGGKVANATEIQYSGGVIINGPGYGSYPN
jgi:hypothetical protein